MEGKNINWEIYCDRLFYNIWAVRPVGDTDFNSLRLFHMTTRNKAEALQTLLSEAHCAVPAIFVN